jgi:UDP-N-acetyl-2-amino-2-deoxyglucuronate dehydrogenase
MAFNFALIGAAGYIAPRHLRAIKDNGQNLVAIVDNKDSVGIIDSYFPEASFFIEFERFDRHCEKLRRSGDPKRIHYVSICSPNYLHDAHIRFALRTDANAICEKPLVLNPWNADALKSLELETGKNVYTILQLRLHPAIMALKKKIDSAKGKKHDLVLTYITPRGKWYHYSWKGDVMKSGGIATNIGVHFFDMLIWIFGGTKKNIVHHYAADKAGGTLELENANVRWYLSIDKNDLPDNSQKTYRSITLDGEEIEFSEGFTDLHTLSYAEILKGNGFRIDETVPSIQTVYDIRNSVPIGLKGDFHPFLKKLK